MLLYVTLHKQINSLLWDFLLAVNGVIIKLAQFAQYGLISSKKREEGMSTESQVEVRDRARGRCSLCQSWQIGQLPVRCGEEGRRGRRGQLKDPWQAGKARRKRRRSLLKAAGGSAPVDGRSQRTLFW